jgi:hypothetical protein
MPEAERDPKPGEIAQCFQCGKFAVIGEDLQLRMPTTDEQLAINTNAHATESQIVWANYIWSASQVSRRPHGKKAWGIN